MIFGFFLLVFFFSLVVDYHDFLPFSIVSSIFIEIEESIGRSTFIKDLKISELPQLHEKCIELVELLVIFHIISVNLLLQMIYLFIFSND